MSLHLSIAGLAGQYSTHAVGRRKQRIPVSLCLCERLVMLKKAPGAKPWFFLGRCAGVDRRKQWNFSQKCRVKLVSTCSAVFPIRAPVVPCYFSLDDPWHDLFANKHYFGPWGEGAPAEDPEESTMCQVEGSTLCPRGKFCMHRTLNPRAQMVYLRGYISPVTFGENGGTCTNSCSTKLCLAIRCYALCFLRTRRDSDGPVDGCVCVLQVAYAGVAMGLLPPTVAGGSEGPTWSSMVAVARPPSSLWFSAPDMVRSRLFH